MNLIGKSTEPEVWENHIQDSLALLPFLEKNPVKNVIDIGSGGGLPAIPLSIFLPEKLFILTEVDSKKLAFLEYAVKKLGLNAEVKDLNREFVFQDETLITSRAFSEIKNILEWARLHTVNTHSYYLLKGRDEVVAQELVNAGSPVVSIHPLDKGCIVEIMN